MWRRLILPVVTALAVAAGLAYAQGGGGSPPVATSAAKALRLPPNDECMKRSVMVDLLPPTGVTFTSLTVRVEPDELLHLSGLAGPGALKVLLPAGRTRVRVSAATSTGRFIRSARTYRRCPPPGAPKPKPRPEPEPTTPPITGGGED